MALYAAAFIAMGLLKPWAAPGCNNPVFAEIVPSQMRNLIYAFDRCFEGAIAACAAPLVRSHAVRGGFSAGSFVGEAPPRPIAWCGCRRWRVLVRGSTPIHIAAVLKVH